MKRYLAVKEESAIYLSHTGQIEKYRQAGCTVYELDGDKKTVIADPDRVSDKEIKIEIALRGGIGNAEK